MAGSNDDAAGGFLRANSEPGHFQAATRKATRLRPSLRLTASRPNIAQSVETSFGILHRFLLSLGPMRRIDLRR
jgi:hypothetical protein